jgi:hypothetical protein
LIDFVNLWSCSSKQYNSSSVCCDSCNPTQYIEIFVSFFLIGKVFSWTLIIFILNLDFTKLYSCFVDVFNVLPYYEIMQFMRYPIMKFAKINKYETRVGFGVTTKNIFTKNSWKKKSSKQIQIRKKSKTPTTTALWRSQL